MYVGVIRLVVCFTTAYHPHNVYKVNLMAGCSQVIPGVLFFLC